MTLRKALFEYEQIFMASRNLAQRTRTEYLHDLEDLIRFLEQLGLQVVKSIGLPQLQLYLAELDHRGIAGSTRKRKVITIRSFLWYLYQDSYISTNLAKRLIPPFAEPKTPRYLTKSEYECLLAACVHNVRDFAMIQLLLKTGIKLSELTCLTVTDVELPSLSCLEMDNSGRLHVSRGGRNERILPLNYKVCRALNIYIKSRPSTTCPALFINQFGKSLGPRGVEKAIDKYLKQIGIRNANAQSLRHTFGIYHALKGTATKTIQELLGHKDVNSTMIYISSTRQMRKEMHNNALRRRAHSIKQVDF